LIWIITAAKIWQIQPASFDTAEQKRLAALACVRRSVPPAIPYDCPLLNIDPVDELTSG
jgi:hypothetical protein